MPTPDAADDRTFERVEHLNRVLRAIRNVNQLITHAKDSDALLQGACDCLTETRGYYNAWIATLDEERRLIAGYASGVGEAFDAMRERLRAGSPTRCAREALATDGVVVTADPAVACNDCPLAAAYSGRAGLTTRLSHAGRVFGVLAVSLPPALARDREEQELLAEVAGDLAYALHAMEAAAGQARLHASLARMHRIVSSSPSVAFRWKAAPGWPVAYVSENVDRFGYAPDDFLSGRVPYADIIHPEDRERVAAEVASHAAGKEDAFEQEYRILDAAGKVRWVDDRTTVERDADGRPVAFHGVVLDITEQKATEAHLARFRAAVEASADAVFLIDRDAMRFVDVNSAACATLGCTREALLQMGPQHIKPAYTERQLADEFDEVIASRKDTGKIESLHRRADGTDFPVEVLLRPLFQDGRRLIIAIARDITERRRAEAALREEQARYREIFQGSRDGFVLVDGEGGFLEANAAFCSMLGYSLEELRNLESFYQITPERWHAWEEEEIWRKRLLGGGYSGLYEKEYVRKDGTVFPVELQSYAVRDGAGELRYLWGVARDITERRRAEEALRESEQRLELVLEGAGLGTWDWDLQTDAAILNDRWATMKGYQPSEIRPHVDAWKELVHPDDLPGAEEKLAAHLRGETPQYEAAVRMRHKSGDWMWIQDRGKVIERDANGAPVRACGTHADITERRLLEERLRQMEKMDAIGQLAGGVAHDFNNQLAGIMGYAEMLLERLEDPMLEKCANRILVASRRSADLTKQLLAFARKGQYARMPVNLHETIAEVVAILQHTIDRRIEIRQHLDANPAVTTGDPSQLQSAILNLGLNARDAMPEGGELLFQTDLVELDEAYCAAAPYRIELGRYVRVSVTDSGCGMDAETQEHAFEPFFTTKGVSQGTGMGLAAVYGTVKHHGGAINIYSEPGEGTTIRVYLPLAAAAVAQAPSAAAPDRPVRPPRAARVLVADDEDLFRDLAREMLEADGHTVETRDNGKDAVDFFAAHAGEIDLVILDMIMPRMDGADTFRAMKEIDPGVKVLLASGYSINGKAEGLLAEGVRGFLQKPFSQTALAEQVAKLLGEEA